MNTKEQLRRKIIQCVQRGEFTLSSGMKSDIFVDLSILTRTSYNQQLLIGELLPHITPDIESIGGPSRGADALVTGILTTVEQDLSSFLVDKNGELSGQPTGNCVIVEDVVTTGKSVKKVIDLVREKGASVAFVLCVLERQNNPFSCPLVSLFSINDII